MNPEDSPSLQSQAPGCQLRHPFLPIHLATVHRPRLPLYFPQVQLHLFVLLVLPYLYPWQHQIHKYHQQCQYAITYCLVIDFDQFLLVYHLGRVLKECSIFVPRKSDFDLIIEYETSKSFIDGKLEWLSNISLCSITFCQ